jgi:hypothetical protein
MRLCAGVAAAVTRDERPEPGVCRHDIEPAFYYPYGSRAAIVASGDRRAPPLRSNHRVLLRVLSAMVVFTSEYREGVARRWESRPEKDWPLVARIALQNDQADDRDRIEAYVAELDSADRPKLTRNLQSEKQFITTYGELLIGHVLAAAGLTPRYEPELRLSDGVCTPDWYIDGAGPIVCDVFTAGLPQRRDADETSLRDIEARLAVIPAGYMVSLEVENASSLDPRARKDLATAVQRWLASGVQKGDVTRIGSATLEVLHVGGRRLNIVTTESIHIVETPAKLAEKFEEKAKKYARLGLPVIGAAVKQYRAEINRVDVEDVLLGQLAYVSYEMSSGQIVGRTERLDNGVFAARPELSAAMWLEPYHLPQPVLGVWENSAACKAVPNEMLKRIADVSL